jgi:hypothetical protein
MTWLSDDPIDTYLDDKLNFDNAATILKNLIVQSNTPISIGINGKWGSGKSSMMRLVKEKLENDGNQKILTSWFETWNYANEKEIWRVLMISLIDDLDPNNKYSIDIKKLISSILNIGFITSNAWLSQGASLYAEKSDLIETIKNLTKIKKSREESIIRDQIRTIKAFRVDFEQIVEKAVGDDGKFIIFIDDLDRIMPEKVVDVIEAIKTFLNCKRCVFVIGCDYDYLNTCIGKRYDGMNLSGKDYIEKIVQIPFNVPSMEGPVFFNFLNSNLKTFFLIEEFITAADLITESIGRNPRKIKRLINLYNIIFDLNNNELNNLVLFKLLCFMMRWPEHHRKFVEAYYKGANKFMDYERWANPIESFEEFMGFDIYEPDVDYTQPASPAEDYEFYVKRMKTAKDRVEKELRDNIKNSDEESLKIFFGSPPSLPSKNMFDRYVALIETIDLNTVESKEKVLLNAMPSINKIDELVKEALNCFDGQKVDGKYFCTSKVVVLPKKSIHKKGRVVSIKEKNKIGEWKYNIIKNNYKLEVNTIKQIELQNKEAKIFWLISPWKFPKSMIDLANEKGNFYLTDYLLLQELLNKLKKK